MSGIGFAAAGTWLGKIALPPWLRTALILVAVAAACFLLGQCRGVSKERAAWEARIAKARAAAAERNAAAQINSAEREIEDRRAVDQMEGDYGNAIREAPDSAPDAAGRALACERLRRAYPGAELPPAC